MTKEDTEALKHKKQKSASQAWSSMTFRHMNRCCLNVYIYHKTYCPFDNAVAMYGTLYRFTNGFFTLVH